MNKAQRKAREARPRQGRQEWTDRRQWEEKKTLHWALDSKHVHKVHTLTQELVSLIVGSAFPRF